jgi:hypothetical protein
MPITLAKFSEARKNCKKKVMDQKMRQHGVEAISIEEKCKKRTLDYQSLGYKDWMNGVFWA